MSTIGDRSNNCEPYGQTSQRVSLMDLFTTLQNERQIHRARPLRARGVAVKGVNDTVRRALVDEPSFLNSPSFALMFTPRTRLYIVSSTGDPRHPRGGVAGLKLVRHTGVLNKEATCYLCNHKLVRTFSLTGYLSHNIVHQVARSIVPRYRV